LWPIALATLITFLLSRWSLAWSVGSGARGCVVTVIAMFTIFAGASWGYRPPDIDLADKLPDYQA